MRKNSDRLLTITEAASRLGLKEATIRKQILQRRIPYVKLGRSVRVPVEAIDKLISDGFRLPLAAERHAAH